MSRLKIFSVYYGQNPVPLYRSDCVEPIQAGCAVSGLREGMLRDDVGDNISAKNRVWAELTAHYWLWKNHLPAHAELDYVGMCHYRRFLDFARAPRNLHLKHVAFGRFARGFAERYSEANVMPCIDAGGFDVVVPAPARLARNVRSCYEQYVMGGHSVRDLDALMKIVRSDYADYVPDMEAWLNGRHAYLWLQFVMRRDWAMEYLAWQFDILQKLESVSAWPDDAQYSLVRSPAFLAERFFNVWLGHKLRTEGGKLLERQCLFLVPDEELRLMPQLKRYANFAMEAVRQFLPAGSRRGSVS